MLDGEKAEVREGATMPLEAHGRCFDLKKKMMVRKTVVVENGPVGLELPRLDGRVGLRMPRPEHPPPVPLLVLTLY